MWYPVAPPPPVRWGPTIACGLAFGVGLSALDLLIVFVWGGLLRLGGGFELSCLLMLFVLFATGIVAGMRTHRVGRGAIAGLIAGGASIVFDVLVYAVIFVLDTAGTSGSGGNTAGGGGGLAGLFIFLILFAVAAVIVAFGVRCGVGAGLGALGAWLQRWIDSPATAVSPPRLPPPPAPSSYVPHPPIPPRRTE